MIEMSRKEEKRSNLVKTYTSVGNPKEEGDITNIEDLLKVQEFKPHIGHLSPGVQHWEDKAP